MNRTKMVIGTLLVSMTISLIVMSIGIADPNIDDNCNDDGCHLESEYTLNINQTSVSVAPLTNFQIETNGTGSDVTIHIFDILDNFEFTYLPNKNVNDGDIEDKDPDVNEVGFILNITSPSVLLIYTIRVIAKSNSGDSHVVYDDIEVNVGNSTTRSTATTDKDGGNRDLWEDEHIILNSIGVLASVGVLVVVVALSIKFFVDNKRNARGSSP